MPSDKFQYALSSAVGMFFGSAISLIVDSALFEIGESAVFATVFGVCLFVIGGLMLWRVAPAHGERMSRWRWLVFIFSCLVIASGLCCFLLEKHWLTGLSAAFKTPMYTMLGTSLCFAFTFSIVDLVNAQVCHCCTSPEFYAMPPVQTSKQVYVVLLASLVMGGLFGLSFGLEDVEDAPNLHTRFDQDQAINTLIGALCGILVGAANQHLRDKAAADAAPYVSFSTTEYGDDRDAF
mmetsp:Transcript_45878/g.109490  ORF Transcript_45878/g.109490 Transcript_45878/m.109490 type:complete len:236 (-) Transcript_45878:48-755(-)